jgi:hypothetical protein
MQIISELSMYNGILFWLNFDILVEFFCSYSVLLSCGFFVRLEDKIVIN